MAAVTDGDLILSCARQYFGYTKLQVRYQDDWIGEFALELLMDKRNRRLSTKCSRARNRATKRVLEAYDQL